MNAIYFSNYSAHCLRRFPGEAIFEEAGQTEVHRQQVITRLFPNLKFGCFGTIVRVTAAVRDIYHGDEDPKIQIWREDKIQPGLYHKISSSVQIKKSDPPCYRSSLNSRVFQCILRADYRISVQPGDFLGLETPSIDNEDFSLGFTSGWDEQLTLFFDVN